MSEQAHWTFFSNHAHVLIALARNPNQPLREVAMGVGITERAVQRIVTDLEDGGYLKRSREGRSNRYKIQLNRPLRHPLEAHCELQNVLQPLLESAPAEPVASASEEQA